MTLLLLLVPSAKTPTLTDERVAAAKTMEPVVKKAEALLVEGKFAEADKAVKGAFPEAGRTAIQTLVLANTLFTRDRKASYELHRRAADQLPDSSDAQYEWALEQHRAKDYAGALKTYEKVIAAQPDFAPPYAMAAECAIRTGNTRRAIELWQGSEKARNGSLEAFESLVCEINGTDNPHAQRQALYPRVLAKDEKAAVELLLLDAIWPFDWWNTHAHKKYLEQDTKLVRSLFPSAGQGQLKEAICVGECSLANDENADRMVGVLKKYGYLVGENAVLPENPRAQRAMIEYVLNTKILTRGAARERWGKRVLDGAMKSGDGDALHAAAILYLDADELEAINRAGWEKAKDPTFAVSFLYGLAKKKKLNWNTEELQRARREFPENSEVALIVTSVGMEAGQNKSELLVAAIKAEYSKFSSSEPPATVVMRPRANRLRTCFRELSANP